MGHLVEKYTSDYFTGFKKGNISYGATVDYDENGNYCLRNQDLSILSKINFSGLRVLEFGFGRGEAAQYALNHGAISYNGVDFSQAACDLAQQIKLPQDSPTPLFTCSDALTFLQNLVKQKNTSKIKPFDCVIAFDFIEHVPRSELSAILELLQELISERTVIAINTPAYKHDNDVISNGYDARNQVDCLDLSDTIEETKGMHCNKYSRVSLAQYMNDHGYENITARNLYRKKTKQSFNLLISYHRRWKNAKESCLPLLGEYTADSVEFPYNEPVKNNYTFLSGNMASLTLLLSDEYKDIAFAEGEYDAEHIAAFMCMANSVSTIFDVGGFMGVTALLYAMYSGQNVKIVIFEPNPNNVDRILENISLNPTLDEKIQVAPIALSSACGVTDMILTYLIDNGYSSTSRLINSHATISNLELPNGFFSEKVTTQTLDQFCADNQLIPDLIKIDIEGAEQFLLQGAQEILSKNHPSIFIEMHSEFSALKSTEILVHKGYEFLILKEESDNRIFLKATYTNNTNDIKNKTLFQNTQLEECILKSNKYKDEIGILSKQLKQNEDEIDVLSKQLKQYNESPEDILQNFPPEWCHSRYLFQYLRAYLCHKSKLMRSFYKRSDSIRNFFRKK